MRYRRSVWTLLFFAVPGTVLCSDWGQFRGPTGQGTCHETAVPVQWSAADNISWKVKLPGAGASSPIILGKRIYITCYSGYGIHAKEPGKQEDLRRHVLCLDRADGKIIWSRQFEAILPEHKYAGEGAYQGYAASTPITDGEKLYVFFGKSGVFCFDLDGNQRWHVLVGKGINGWGSGASPMIYKDLLIVNASVEAGALIALDKATGKEVWRAPNVGSAWGTPVLVTNPEKKQELVLSMQGRVAGFDPDTGKELWSAAGHKGYVVPSVVVHDGIVYTTPSGPVVARRCSGRRSGSTPTPLATTPLLVATIGRLTGR
jgi:outer membrane protein assembly factor BamB